MITRAAYRGMVRMDQSCLQPYREVVHPGTLSSPSPSGEPGLDDLDGHDEDEVRDRDRGEETEGRAPAIAPDDRPGSRRLRDDEVGDHAADREDQDDVERQR